MTDWLPAWIREVAWDGHKLIQLLKARPRFRQMMRSWGKASDARHRAHVKWERRRLAELHTKTYRMSKGAICPVLPTFVAEEGKAIALAIGDLDRTAGIYPTIVDVVIKVPPIAIALSALQVHLVNVG